MSKAHGRRYTSALSVAGDSDRTHQIAPGGRSTRLAGVRLWAFVYRVKIVTSLLLRLIAGIAQLVERRVANAKVAGSSPVSRSPLLRGALLRREQLRSVLINFSLVSKVALVATQPAQRPDQVDVIHRLDPDCFARRQRPLFLRRHTVLGNAIPDSLPLADGEGNKPQVSFHVVTALFEWRPQRDLNPCR